jgi:hypothetical protein
MIAMLSALSWTVIWIVSPISKPAFSNHIPERLIQGENLQPSGIENAL